jgi:hypothetical protein
MSPQTLKIKFEEFNFRVEYEIKTGMEIMSKHMLLERLSIRDTSQLYMVPDKLFNKRFNDVLSWPDDRKILGDFAFLNFTAHKNA